MRILPRWHKIIAIIFFVAMINSCVPAPPLLSGRDITTEQLALLKSKSLTKREMLDLLGPPYAIFIPGETANVQRGAEWNSSGNITGTRYEKVDSSTAFALFPHSSDPLKDNRVYYYYHSKSSKFGVILILALHEQIKNRKEELYVLVNERKGVISDIFYHRGKLSE